jgi:large subunit ribosomal protein L21
MYAIVEIAGQQFKVEKDQQIFVHRLDTEEGSKVDFDKVLLLDNAGKVNVGAPVIKGAKVTAKVLEHLKGDKVIVFKKKRRKGYKVKNGHRQYLTKLEILKIDAKAPAAKKAAPKKEAKPVAEKAPAKKTAAKKPAAKKAPAKKTTAKKAE